METIYISGMLVFLLIIIIIGMMLVWQQQNRAERHHHGPGTYRWSEMELESEPSQTRAKHPKVVRPLPKVKQHRKKAPKQIETLNNEEQSLTSSVSEE